MSWPVRRVTFQQANGWQMNTQVAEHFFRGKDDLATEFPPRADHPAAQNWDNVDLDGDGDKDPLARQWTGDYSWIVSVVPTSNAARDAMARNPESYAYDVSVVVFYKRTFPPPPTRDLPQADMISNVRNERVVNARIISTGLNGGEIFLHALGEVSESPYSQLKTGQWIMLCGPHPESHVQPIPGSSPQSWMGEPRFVLKWYQVLSIDAEGTNVPGFNPTNDRIVAVRGPEWPWRPRLEYPSGQQNSDVAILSDQLCVGIVRGAVAVHTKTLRLNSSGSSGGGGGMAIITPPGSTPPKFGVY
jgi:hypothetical protein